MLALTDRSIKIFYKSPKTKAYILRYLNKNVFGQVYIAIT